ncbi:MAG TPA: endonuclease/exonuclease/phosphatase family protein, partial [Phycisphaerae bacterium]|nr:endonuclease/exonuclease/phosphatase family protein [Phycisphaerae bacterium]
MSKCTPVRVVSGIMVCLWPLTALPAADEAAPVPVISWQDARDHLDREVAVVGKVVRGNKSGQGNVFLNFAEDWKDTLSVFIPKQTVELFPQSPDELYQGKTIKVRGKITLYRGSPSLTVNEPSAVAVLPDDASVPDSASPASQPAGTTPAASPSPVAPNIRPDEYLPVVPWHKAADFIDQEVFVVGKVVRASRPSSDGPAFLNFSEDIQNTLSIFIRKDSVAKFPESPDKLYLDKVVRIRGRLILFKNHPSLTLHGPENVTVLPDDAVIPAEAVLPAKVKPPMSAVPGADITVGTYNVMNLFDVFDDPYSDDTPEDAKPRAQLAALARSIRSLNADVLALQEAENRSILEAFVRAFLADMGYEVVLFEGNDTRGIDVAVLSRLPVGAVTSHRHLLLPDAKGNMTRFRRDLLQVRIQPPGGTSFDVFVVHLKSKAGEEAGGLDLRLGEATQVRVILNERLKTDPNAQFVLCGDFNDTQDSEPIKAILGSGPGQLASFFKDLPADDQVTFNREPYREMIDFILASPAMSKRYVARSYRVFPGSPEV